MKICKDDLIRDLELENNRTKTYFDLMYKILQFTFVAIIALLAIIFNSNINIFNLRILLQYILPICMYVFGMMYIYNAYALAISGERAEILQFLIYEDIDDKNKFKSIVSKYICTNRKITLISYGVPLGFYILMPFASCLFATIKTESFKCLFFNILPWIFCGIYYALMGVLIAAISNKHFIVDKIQSQRIRKKD